VVLSVDEKPSIQALERAQGYLKLPNGRAMTGQSHDYKRHEPKRRKGPLDHLLLDDMPEANKQRGDAAIALFARSYAEHHSQNVGELPERRTWVTVNRQLA
jgi:hypothetical protein